MAKLVLFFANGCISKRKTYLHKPCGAKTFAASTTIYYFCSQNNNKNIRNMERLFFFVIAAALAFGVGCLGRNRKIGFGWAFGISLINVVIGLIVVLCSKKKTSNELEKKN